MPSDFFQNQIWLVKYSIKPPKKTKKSRNSFKISEKTDLTKGKSWNLTIACSKDVLYLLFAKEIWNYLSICLDSFQRVTSFWWWPFEMKLRIAPLLVLLFLKFQHWRHFSEFGFLTEIFNSEQIVLMNSNLAVFMLCVTLLFSFSWVTTIK